MPVASVIIPFHCGRAALERAVRAVALSVPEAEIIIVANGAVEDVTSIAGSQGARLLSLNAACGPAVARNRGAELARAAILVFVDADVVVAPQAIPAMLDVLAARASLTGIFGAYDHSPEDGAFFSQFRNLAHAFVHKQAKPEARTFWGGLGALRASAFQDVGGFDERFTRPSIEDIDLGYRLTRGGYRLKLDPEIRGTHLKRWTFRSSVISDVRDRGVPWVQTILKFGADVSDLNVSWTGRLSVLFAYLLASTFILALIYPVAGIVATAALGGFVAVNSRFFRFFLVERGWIFALRVLPFHIVHHLCNGVSLATGTALWLAERLMGWRTRWTIPADVWPKR